MSTSPLLQRDHVVVPLETTTLDEAVAKLTRQLGRTGALREPDAIVNAFLQQKNRAATRIAPEIALPHYRTDAVDRVVVALGVNGEPLRTGDAEWTPGPRIVALVLAPMEAHTLYLQAVSALARAVRHTSIVERLADAKNVDDVFALESLAELEIRPRITVRDVMVTVAETTRPDETVRHAVEAMLRSGARALPVVGDKGEVLGLVGEKDVMRVLVQGGNRSREARSPVPPLRVRDIMTRSVMCIPDTASLEEVAHFMTKKEVGEIPVVAGGKLAGIVRRGDILRTLYGR